MSKQIPGPRGWPVIGNKRQIDFKQFHVTLGNLKDKYGGLVQFSVFSTRIIAINDVVLMKKAFHKKELCHRSTNFFTGLKYNSGYLDSNFTEEEVTLRSSLQSALVATHGDAVLKDFTARELQRFLTSLDSTEGVPVLSVLRNSIAKVFTIQISGVQAEDRHSHSVIEYLDATRNLFSEGKVPKLTKFPWLQHLPGPYKSATRNLKRARDKVTNTLVTDAVQGHKEGQNRGILQHMMSGEVLRGKEETKREAILVGYTMDLLFNSVIPISQNLAFILLQAAKHPGMQREIHGELDGLSKPIDLCDIQLDNIPYTEAFILECMRYLSTVNITPFHVASENTEIDGYLFPKGSIIFGNLFTVHHDEKLWNQPWQFNPNRFLDKERKRRPKTDAIYQNLVHFSFGMRQCRGSNISMETIMRYAIGILSRYSVLPVSDTDLPSSDPRDYQSTIVLVVPEFKCKFEKRLFVEKL